MGYTSDLMSTTLSALVGMQRDLTSLINLFDSDADQQMQTAGALKKDGQLSGKDATALEKLTQIYRTLVRGNALDRLQQIADACSRYHNTIQSASDAFDGQYPPNYSDYTDYLFANSSFTMLTEDLLHADHDILAITTPARPAYIAHFTQRYTSSGQQMHRFIMDEIEAEITDVNSALYAWSDALQRAYILWQTTLNNTDVQAIDVPMLNYDNSAGLNVPIPIDTKYESILTGAFNALDNGNGIQALPPESYLEIMQIYPDIHTQDALKLLMTTPTGRQFAEYYLYMGKQCGADFITWQHLGADVGALTTDGGYVIMNLDDPSVTQGNRIELAGDLVHEGVESYFNGAMGIRQMGTKHADYVAEWFQGKFMQEAGITSSSTFIMNGTPHAKDGQDDTRAYNLDYKTWLGNQGTNIYTKEDENVYIFGDSNLGRDRPGFYWPGTGDWKDIGGDIHNVAGYVDIGSHWVANVPNPMGLDPRMLKSIDLTSTDPHVRLPPLPPTPIGLRGRTH